MDPARFADAKDPMHRGGGLGDNRQNERLGMAQAAYEWRRCMEESENVLRSLSASRWVEVRYEDCCQDPVATLRRLQQFLGVEPVGLRRDFRTAGQHVVGNGMRLDTTSEIQLDERWRRELTEQDLRIFNRVAGETNQRHGYE